MKSILTTVLLFLAFQAHAEAGVKANEIRLKNLVGYCGDGIINGNEQCDGTAVSVASCGALNGGEGVVSCQSNCVFDISDCHSPIAPPSIIDGTPRIIRDGFCGDGIINGTNEDCDQGAIQNTDCRDYGLSSGRVSCQANCLYDMSDCR